MWTHIICYLGIICKACFWPTMFTYTLQFICLSLLDLLYWNLGHSISDSSTAAIFSTEKGCQNYNRFTLFSTHTHTQPLFQSLSILPVDKLILNQISMFMYKYCNGLLPNVMNRFYVKNKDIHSHNIINNNLLRIDRGTVNFTNLSARVWNVLTRNINMYMFLVMYLNSS